MYPGLLVRNSAAAESLIAESDLVRMSDCTEVELHQILGDIRSHYTVWISEKSNGKARQICTPSRRLRRIQRSILKCLYICTKTRKYATGGVPKKSVDDFARPHIKQDFVFATDISNFFPSVSMEAVRSVFNKIGFSAITSDSLTQLCTLDGSLPQGAATSPYISNLFLDEFDFCIGRMANRRNWAYTRYIDDIAISGRDVDLSTLGPVKSTLSRLGLTIAEHKTRLMDRSDKQVLAGLVVNDVLRPTKRYINDLEEDIQLCNTGKAEIVAGRLSVLLEDLPSKINGQVRHIQRYDDRSAKRLRKLLYDIHWA